MISRPYVGFKANETCFWVIVSYSTWDYEPSLQVMLVIIYCPQVVLVITSSLQVVWVHMRERAGSFGLSALRALRLLRVFKVTK